MRPFTNGTVLRAVSDAAYPFWPRDRRVCQIQGQLTWAHGWYKPWKAFAKGSPDNHLHGFPVMRRTGVEQLQYWAHSVPLALAAHSYTRLRLPGCWSWRWTTMRSGKRQRSESNRVSELPFLSYPTW